MEEKNNTKFSVVHSQDIGEGTSIGEFSYIESDVKIGKNCKIHQNVVIKDGSIIGDSVEIFPGAFIGKTPSGAGQLIHQPKFSRNVFIGNGCSIGPHSIIYYDVIIGESCLIGDGVSIRENVSIGHKCVIARYVTINYSTKIGNNTRIMDQTHITANSVIGNHVFISVLVGTSNDNTMGKISFDNDGQKLGPNIHDGARIGLGAKLLPGVIIGKDSVIGAGSVVTKNVLEFSKVIGIPAKSVPKRKI